MPLPLGLLALGALASTGVVAHRALFHRVRGHTFESAGARLHYTDEGAGAPVVLLHGFAVNADLNFRRPGITAALAREFRVVALDQRGHGLSDKPNGPGAYGLQMVDDVLRLLDHLGLERAHVAGYSLGGFVAFKLAATRSDRLLSASVLGAGWESADGTAFLKALERLADELEAGRGIGPLMGALGAKSQKPSLVHTLWVRFVTRVLNDPKALVGVVRGTPALAIREEELAEVRAPICSIVGARDPLVEGARALAGRVPVLHQHILEDADHMQAPLRRELLVHLTAFLRGTTPSSVK